MVRGGLTLFALLLAAAPVRAGEATVAVASNFLTTAEDLAGLFEYATGHDIVLAHGSTGRLYAQIVSGAPFDLYLAADAARPEALEAAGRAADRFTYALGRLVLVSSEPAPEDLAASLPGRRIALADPAVAPYGAAAEEALAALGYALADLDVVFGDSVGQVAALIRTGNADLAFLAASQVPYLGDGLVALDIEGLYTPIRQDAVLLDGDNTAARDFFAYLAGAEAAGVIRAAGYGVPE